MSRKILKYWLIFKTQLLNSLAYPGDLLARSLSIVVFMWAFVHLWRAVYSSAGQTVISGLTLRDTLWYLMLTETLTLSKPRLSRTIAEMVKDGSVAYLLNKPYHFLLYQASVWMGDSLSCMGFNLLAGGAVVWYLVGPPPDPRGWPFTLVVMMIAWLLDFCVAAMIGLAAFVAEDVAAFEWIYSKFLFILGGMLIPLDFFPPWLRSVAQALPFAYTVYGPARFFVQPSMAGFFSLVLGQLFWLAVLGGLVLLFYRRGTTRLAINGG
jgi:ABC-2 type transport system permease protein